MGKNITVNIESWFIISATSLLVFNNTKRGDMLHEGTVGEAEGLKLLSSRRRKNAKIYRICIRDLSRKRDEHYPSISSQQISHHTNASEDPVIAWLATSNRVVFL